MVRLIAVLWGMVAPNGQTDRRYERRAIHADTPDSFSVLLGWTIIYQQDLPLL
jgi:hypothetical protein